jgi:hypothetical protein
MSVSDDFTKLRAKADDADRSIRAAVAQDGADLTTTLQQARKDADERATALRLKSEEAAASTERQWHEVQSDWDEHVKRLRARVDAKKAAHDVKVAERDAESAELDALDAIDFAEAAIVEAEYAVLDAVQARRDADVAAATV